MSNGHAIPTTFRKFSEIGEDIAFRWGKRSASDPDDLVLSLDARETVKCLLAAVVRRLIDMHDCHVHQGTLLLDMARAIGVGSDPVADALLVHYRGEPVVEREGIRHLSVRARRALEQSGLVGRPFSEVTQDRLYAVRGCGFSTVHEIEEWMRLTRKHGGWPQ